MTILNLSAPTLRIPMHYKIKCRNGWPIQDSDRTCFLDVQIKGDGCSYPRYLNNDLKVEFDGAYNNGRGYLLGNSCTGTNFWYLMLFEITFGPQNQTAFLLVENNSGTICSWVSCDEHDFGSTCPMLQDSSCRWHLLPVEPNSSFVRLFFNCNGQYQSMLMERTCCIEHA